MAKFTRKLQKNRASQSFVLTIPRPVVEGLGLQGGEFVVIEDFPHQRRIVITPVTLEAMDDGAGV